MTNPIATALESIFKYQTCQRCEDVVLSAVNEIEVITLERDKARRERDEARRLHCRMSAQFVYLSGELCTAKFVADEKGWDCFKEETP